MGIAWPEYGKGAVWYEPPALFLDVDCRSCGSCFRRFRHLYSGPASDPAGSASDAVYYGRKRRSAKVQAFQYSGN